ncbi:MAG: hypothetical protein Q4F54_05075 [Coriobacteriia bacterium]|nr:hypothetical protein [Coriobacteriia bacterium]
MFTSNNESWGTANYVSDPDNYTFRFFHFDDATATVEVQADGSVKVTSDVSGRVGVYTHTEKEELHGDFVC